MWTETAPGDNIMKFYADVSAKLRQKEETVPEYNNRPWQSYSLAVTVTADDIIGNELEDLYNETVAKTLPEMKRIALPAKSPSPAPLVLPTVNYSGMLVVPETMPHLGFRPKPLSEENHYESQSAYDDRSYLRTLRTT